jgi:hypothetical protein
VDMMEILLDRQQAAINELDAQNQEMLAVAKSLHANTEARANTTIKQEEDLNARSPTISEQERAVVERERDLQVHHEAVDTRLERELKGVASREAGFDSRETSLAEEWKKLEEA